MEDSRELCRSSGQWRHATINWKRHYLHAAIYFLVAVLITFRLDLAPLVMGGLTFVGFLDFGLDLRRRHRCEQTVLREMEDAGGLAS
jgi:hypothetical protein